MPSPCWGPAVAPGSPLLLPVPVPCLLALAVSAPWSLSPWSHGCSALLLRLLMEACHLGAPAAESQRLIARCIFSLHCFWLTAHFCPLLSLVRALGRLMSRGDELRQLAAQLSVLAALEDSVAVGLSRVMGPASPGRGAASPVSGSPLVPAAPAASAASAPAPSPSHEVAASLLRSASLRASSPRTRTRSRSPAPLPKRAPRAPRRSSSVASSLRGSVALAESGLVTGLATKSCPPVPPPQLRLSRVARALHAASTESQPPAVASGPSAPTAPALRPLVPRSLRPTPMTNGTRSLTHTVSLAPRPPSPSRLSPLELVGVLATSVADVSARLPSVPCGGTSSPLPSPLCLPPDRRVHAGGPALVLCALSRVMSSCRPLQFLLWLWVSPVLRGSIGAVSGAASRSASLCSLWSSTLVARLLWHALPRLVWWPPYLAKRSHSRWACCSWTSSSCSSVRRLLVVS